MFCDMVGFTSLSDRLSPEEVYSIADEVFEMLIHKVSEVPTTGVYYPTCVARHMGAAAAALLGRPDVALAHYQAALEMANEVSTVSEQWTISKQGCIILPLVDMGKARSRLVNLGGKSWQEKQRVE